MKVHLCIIGLSIFVNVANGEELVMNKLLREHVQRTTAKTNEMTMELAVAVIREKHNVSLEYLDPRLYHKTPRSLRHQAISALQVDTDTVDSGPTTTAALTGYAAVRNAMKMLNKMIYSAEENYQTEIERCCAFDKSQSALMEETRQAISNANEKAAEGKRMILESESSITTCETQIPKLGEQLREWNGQCKSETEDLDRLLKIVTADVDVIGQIIEASKCEKELNTAMMLYQCEDECGDYELVDWGEPMTPRMHALALELVSQSPTANANLTTTTPSPRTLTRSRPCKAPRTMSPESAKCTIKKSPQCAPLVEKFYNIQTGLLETQNELETKRSELVARCADTRANLESQIAGFEQKLKDSNTALAAATAANAEAMETSRLKGKQLLAFLKNYKDMTAECHNNYDQLEAEICALNKIRGDVFNKLQGTKDPAFFTDCKVSEWVEVEPGCSVSCGGGVVNMRRTIEVYPVGGADCPALGAVETCNLQNCPIDCRVGDWSGWSDCSAKCGGGVQDRNRPVLVEPMYKGEGCGDIEQVQSCNPQSCDADCVLSDWTAWSNCSKSCNQGHSTRIRTVLEPAMGGGTCADIDGPVRLQKEFCNVQACPMPLLGSQLLTCQSKKDLVVLIDGSGSVGKKGWDIQVEATKMLMDSFVASASGSDMSIIVYSGPKWLCDYYQCMGYADRSWYFRRYCKKKTVFDCGTEIVSHLTTDTTVLKKNLTAVKWPGRTTFTSKALAAVESELNMGQKDASSVVVVMTDGYPADKRGTRRAAKKLNKKAKVIWVPITKNAPLKKIRKWASDPENVIPVENFKDLTKAVVNDIVATACIDIKAN